MFPPADLSSSFPFRVVAKVGEGAMGMVFRAEDVELGRPVALKVIKPGQVSSLPGDEARVAVQRFLQEARAAARLTHPGVTTVHRVGTESGWPYIAMEWIDGQTLEQVLRQHRRLSLPVAARLGLQLLAVLGAAHEAGIVHRDIKPANLMLTRDGRLKVADFGIARVQGSDLAHTRAGMVLGTPRYAAPEQLAGENVDFRADLYAAGCVLFEAVCGRPPFDAGQVYQLVHDVQTRPPVAPSQLVSGLPPAFDALILKALAKRPDERFSSAADMARALQTFVASPARPAVSVAPAVAEPPMVLVEGQSPPTIVASLIETWPARALGRQPSGSLLERLLDRPLHAPAFCGALRTPDAVLLICDGLVYTAFDPKSGEVGDAIIERLPDEVDATLHPVPSGADPRLVSLLASLLLPPKTRLTGLDTALTDLPQLARRLSTEGFEGALRFARGPLLGYSLFSSGRRVLDLFGTGWRGLASGRWEQWIRTAGALASVEERRIHFPSFTFRRELREVELEVVRPLSPAHETLRFDTQEEARALDLRLRAEAKEELRRGASTLRALVTGDPAYALTRWLLADLPLQFEQYNRTSRWRALVEPIARVQTARLHHAVQTERGSQAFDAATFAADGRLLHLAERAAEGSDKAVARFIARVTAAKQGPDGARLGGAVLSAKSFSDEAIETYLETVRRGGGPLLAGLGALTHTEGYLRLSARQGVHVLLVEESDGRRRPLVPG